MCNDFFLNFRGLVFKNTDMFRNNLKVTGPNAYAQEQ